MKLSLIIPMYNVEKYIERCLLSVLNQDNVTTDDFEVIIVNDGSPDNSLSIAERVTKAYSNVTIISQVNAGLSAARNTGIEVARGEYIWCIDSDDWIEPHSVHFLLSEIEKGDVDFITIDAQNSNEDKPRNTLKKTASARELLYSSWSPCAVFNIYRKDFLKKYGLTFFPGIFHEDMEFTPRMMYYARCCRVTNELLYHVFINNTSITRSRNVKKSYDCIVVADHLDKFSRDVVTDFKVKDKLSYLISVFINNALANILDHDIEEHKKFNIFIYQYKNLLSHLKKSNQIKYKIEEFLFGLFPRHYVGVYNALCRLK